MPNHNPVQAWNQHEQFGTARVEDWRGENFLRGLRDEEEAQKRLMQPEQTFAQDFYGTYSQPSHQPNSYAMPFMPETLPVPIDQNPQSVFVPESIQQQLALQESQRYEQMQQQMPFSPSMPFAPSPFLPQAYVPTAPQTS